MKTLLIIALTLVLSACTVTEAPLTQLPTNTKFNTTDDKPATMVNLTIGDYLTTEEIEELYEINEDQILDPTPNMEVLKALTYNVMLASNVVTNIEEACRTFNTNVQYPMHLGLGQWGNSAVRFVYKDEAMLVNEFVTNVATACGKYRYIDNTVTNDEFLACEESYDDETCSEYSSRHAEESRVELIEMRNRLFYSETPELTEIEKDIISIYK